MPDMRNVANLPNVSCSDREFDCPVMRDMTFALLEDSHHLAAREATTPAMRGKRYARVHALEP